MSILVAGALACELKGGDSGTAGLTDGGSSESSSEGSSSEGGTEGVSTTSGDPATSSATNVSSSGSSASTTTADPGTTTDLGTTTFPETSTTTVGTVSTTTVGTSDSTGDPIEPKPCEGPAKEIDAHTISYLYSQLPPMPDTTSGGSSGSSGGEPQDPDLVFVRLSSQAATCADPNVGIECGPNWEVTIRIPPPFQTPGLYHLSGPDVTGAAFETGVSDDNNECSFGGGSFLASFELISIDDKSVTGRLCHVENLFFDNNVDLEGSFTAPRCP